MKRIIFLGTSAFGIPVLQAFHRHHDVACVVTGVDKVSGRGRKLLPTPIKTAALELGQEVVETADLSDPGFIERLKGFHADIFFVVAFRILPREVFSIPPEGTINLHASLLPDYRGAAPINHAVINGDSETGLTTFYIGESVDTGDMILSETVAIGTDETAGELSLRMSETGAGLSLRTVGLLEEGGAVRKKQPSKPNRPAPKLHKRDGLIDWTCDAPSIHNRVRGMNPRPGAFTDWSKGPLKIHRTKVVDEGASGTPGRIVEASPRDGIVISCGKGSLRILELQPPGKKIMDSPGFVRGYRIEAGMIISDTGKGKTV